MKMLFIFNGPYGTYFEADHTLCKVKKGDICIVIEYRPWTHGRSLLLHPSFGPIYAFLDDRGSLIRTA